MSQIMPLYFIGHGSPMNIIEQNSYTRALAGLAGGFVPEEARALLVISAHWETRGTQITANSPDQTLIYDFRGFPEELYKATYPAKGDIDIAVEIQSLLSNSGLSSELSLQWGLDHGTWSVLKHCYPNAQVPILQLSLDQKKSFREHFQLGAVLQKLRSQGVVIMASGNVVHNLRQFDWQGKKDPHPLAVEFDERVKQHILRRSHDALVDLDTNDPAVRYAMPTPEHYIPLLYCLGASLGQDDISLLFEGIQNHSMSMTSYKWAGSK